MKKKIIYIETNLRDAMMAYEEKIEDHLHWNQPLWWKSPLLQYLFCSFVLFFFLFLISVADKFRNVPEIKRIDKMVTG